MKEENTRPAPERQHPTLPIADIALDPRAQPRARLDQFAIEEYAAAMKGGTKFPPVVVFEDGDGKRWLADGFHRCHAAEFAGLTEIAAEVRRGGVRDAILYACGANNTHGLRRTNIDKRHAVLALLNDAEWGRWSDRKIAESAAVTHPFVAKVRRTLEESGNGYQLTEDEEQEEGYHAAKRYHAAFSPPDPKDDEEVKEDLVSRLFYEWFDALLEKAKPIEAAGGDWKKFCYEALAAKRAEVVAAGRWV